MKDSRKTHWMLGILAFSGCLTVGFLTFRLGMGISFDSLIYIAVSKSLLSGKGFYYLDGLSTDQPPLYSTFLALLNFAGLDPADAFRLLNATSYGLIIFFSGRWLWKTTQSRALALLGSGLILVSVPLLRVFSMAWTEPLFIAFLTLFFFQFDKFLREEKLRYLVWSAILVSLACLTRYVGVAAVFAGLITLILRRDAPIIKQLIPLTVFGVISTLPISLWLTRNFILRGYLTGFPTSSPRTLTENLSDLSDVISSWFLPSVVTPVVRLSVAAIFVIVLLSCITALIWNDKTGLKYRNFMPTLSFFFTYSILMLYVTTTVAIAPLHNRYLSPIYVPLLMLLCVAIACTKDSVSPHFVRRVLNSVFIGGVIFIFFNSLLEQIVNPMKGEDTLEVVFLEKYDHPGSAEAFMNSGVALAQQRFFREAFVWYTRALELSPDSYEVHNGLGVVSMEMGSLSRALNHFHRALEINPNRVEAYTNIGLCLLKGGKVDEAAEFFSVIIEMQPDNVPMYANLGSIWEAQGKTQEAITIYREALERKPDYDPARQRLNLLLRKMNPG